MASCQRCKQTHSGPEAFLLACRGCSRSWHHRCHMPPIEDDQLIQLIRATTAGGTANGLGSWMCRRCKKGTSATPSSTSSREPTASREDSKSVTSSNSRPAPSTASVASTADVRVKQESSTATVDARPDGPESTEPAPVQRTLSAKRTKPSEANQPHVQPQPGPTQPADAEVHMRDVTPTESIPQEKSRSPARSHQIKAARKFGAVSATSTEDDAEMQVDSPASSESTSRASKAPSSIRAKSVLEGPPHARAASSTEERPQVNQVVVGEADDDPEDLYGPPVERRIIRILPSLAEELREQQRRVAAEKEKRRAPLAPDWIHARHVNDPLWKEIPTQGRKRRKATARRLGDNGLNVDELLGCYMVQNWVGEHKS